MLSEKFSYLSSKITNFKHRNQLKEEFKSIFKLSFTTQIQNSFILDYLSLTQLISYFKKWHLGSKTLPLKLIKQHLEKSKLNTLKIQTNTGRLMFKSTLKKDSHPLKRKLNFSYKQTLSKILELANGGHTSRVRQKHPLFRTKIDLSMLEKLGDEFYFDFGKIGIWVNSTNISRRSMGMNKSLKFIGFGNFNQEMKQVLLRLHFETNLLLKREELLYAVEFVSPVSIPFLISSKIQQMQLIQSMKIGNYSQMMDNYGNLLQLDKEIARLLSFHCRNINLSNQHLQMQTFKSSIDYPQKYQSQIVKLGSPCKLRKCSSEVVTETVFSFNMSELTSGLGSDSNDFRSSSSRRLFPVACNTQEKVLARVLNQSPTIKIRESEPMNSFQYSTSAKTVKSRKSIRQFNLDSQTKSLFNNQNPASYQKTMSMMSSAPQYTPVEDIYTPLKKRKSKIFPDSQLKSLIKESENLEKSIWETSEKIKQARNCRRQGQDTVLSTTEEILDKIALQWKPISNKVKLRKGRLKKISELD